MRGCSEQQQQDDRVPVFTCSMAWPTTTDTRVHSLLSHTVPPRFYWCPTVRLKRSSALEWTAEQTCPPHVSGPLASPTDRRKTVACYVINTVITKIQGVLDSVSLHDPLPGMVNQIPVWNFKIKLISYVQSAQGQKAKASRGFAGVSVRDSQTFTVRKEKASRSSFVPQMLMMTFVVKKANKRKKQKNPRQQDPGGCLGYELMLFAY